MASSRLESQIIAATWVPERWVLAWQAAVWNGPAERDREKFLRFADAVVEHGFGRVRRMLVKLATPGLMCERAAELWRDEHSHGTMQALVGKNSAELVLRDHPYIESDLAGTVLAESMRFAGSLSRVKSIAADHRRLPSSLTVTLRWS